MKMRNMQLLIVALMLLLAVSAKAAEDELPNVEAESNQLWTNIENRLFELERKQGILLAGFRECQIVLRTEKSNSRKAAELEEDTDTDTFNYDAMVALRKELTLVKALQKRMRCSRVSQQDKTDIANIVVETFTKSYLAGIPITEKNTDVCTLDDTSYKFYKFNGTKNEFIFEVAAKNDAHVLLAQSPERNDKSIEIVIGGWGNTKSVIRFGQTELVGRLLTEIVNTCEFRSFWVRWSQFGVEVGRKGEDQPFMQTSAGPSFKVQYIGIHTGFGSSGQWKLKN